MTCNHLNTTIKKTCIAKVPIFNHLNDDEMGEISRASVSSSYRKGDMIVHAGTFFQNLFIIHKGRVKIYRISESGKEQLLRILGPGSFMGELALFGETPITSFAEALEETEICSINKQDINSLILKKPEIAIKVLGEFSRRLENAEKLIEQLGHHDIEKRVASILLELASTEKESENNEITIELSTSKKDLASLIGTTQETLSRKLTHFQDKGIIKLIGHRKILILNKTELQHIIV